MNNLKPLFAFAGEAAHRRIPSAAAVTSGLRARCVGDTFLDVLLTPVQRLTKQFGTFGHRTLKTKFPSGCHSLAGPQECVWGAAQCAALVGQGSQLFLLCTDVDVSICANTYNSGFL